MSGSKNLLISPHRVMLGNIIGVTVRFDHVVILGYPFMHNGIGRQFVVVYLLPSLSVGDYAFSGCHTFFVQNSAAGHFWCTLHLVLLFHPVHNSRVQFPGHTVVLHPPQCAYILPGISWSSPQQTCPVQYKPSH